MGYTFKELGELLSPEDAGKFIDATPERLANWRSRGEGPAFIKVGGSVKYPYNFLREWLLKQMVCPEQACADKLTELKESE